MPQTRRSWPGVFQGQGQEWEVSYRKWAVRRFTPEQLLRAQLLQML